ncbi:MAG TPA: lamin tail domain-containing protein [Candidatus Paceibacterota bacterium]|nr:lamin tail domain-containing protein [Candidatus Paceibacterota bacterium]
MSAKAAAAGALVACVACGAPLVVSAQAVISEIMYDPDGTDAGHEWVEVFNAGASAVPLTEWHFYENETDHRISAVQGGSVLAPGAYAVIADNPALFLTDHPGFAGQLFDSAFSLSNSGEPLALHDAQDVTADAITYDAAEGTDGESLSRTSAAGTAFAAAAPTPGTGSLSPADPGTAGADGTAQDQDAGAAQDAGSTDPQQDAAASSTPASVFPVTPQLYAYAGGDRVVSVGADAEFDGRAFAKDGTELDPSAVRFIWNFGDGATKEGEAVLHHWAHPGRYAVTLTLAEHKFAAMDEITVDAEPAQLSLSVLSDGSIAITNRSSRELDLSGWILASGGKAFALPEHTRLLPGATVPFAPGTTGLTLITHPVMLEYPDGDAAIAEGEAPAAAMAPVAPVPVAPQSAPVPARAPQPIARTSSASSLIGTRIASAASVQDAPERSAPAVQPQPSRAVAASSTASPEAAGFAAAALGTGGHDPAQDSPLWPWVLGAGALAGLGSVSAITARRRGSKAWDIIEEIPGDM